MLSALYAWLLVLVVACSSWAMFEAGGIIIFALVCILAGLLNQAKSLLRAIVYFLGLLFFLALLLPAISYAREAARRAQCMNNLKQLALAVHNYHERYRCFPPAYVADKDGKPMHSWRVLILPFLEKQALYDRYDFNEPWDGPNNKKLLAERPEEYVCPSSRHTRLENTAYTNYVAVVGSNAAWRGEIPRASKDVKLDDKMSTTLMLVEVVDAGINWTEPKDMPLDALPVGTETPPRVTPSSRHLSDNGFFCYSTPEAYVAMADGSVRHLQASSLAPDRLANTLKIGGFREEDAKLDEKDLRIHWPHCAALDVWIVSVCLLLDRAVRSRKDRTCSTTETAVYSSRSA